MLALVPRVVDALGHRAHQLMAVELQAATAQHRPQHHRTPRTTRTRCRVDHHRQPPQKGFAVEGPGRACALTEGD